MGLLTATPFSLSQITGGAFLPCVAGPWKCAMVAGPGDRYGSHPMSAPAWRGLSHMSRAGGAGSPAALVAPFKSTSTSAQESRPRQNHQTHRTCRDDDIRREYENAMVKLLGSWPPLMHTSLARILRARFGESIDGSSGLFFATLRTALLNLLALARATTAGFEK